MRKIAFVVKGQTFLRSTGTLIYFAKKCGIEPHVFYYENRPGKSYDSVDSRIISETLGCANTYLVTSDKHLTNVIDNTFEAVIAQDINWHFPFLVGKLPTFSISMFFDTLHYAKSRKSTKHSVPTKTYFADAWYMDKFTELMGHTTQDVCWPAASLGSPTFDHALFVDTSAYKPKSVLFLAPPQASLDAKMVAQVNELIDYCYKRNNPFVLKDRAKTPWTASNKSKVHHINQEQGFPYSSLILLLNTQIHITAYGTSAVESNFFGRPAINLPAIASGGGRNHDIPGYGTDHIYDNGLCFKTTGNLIDDYEAAIAMKPVAPKRILTPDDNYSIDILNDVINTLDNSD